jgi:hypothetical protein
MEIEMNQAFEQEVTEMISNFEGITIEWYNGTLFYDCGSESTARSVWHLLVEKFGLEHVRFSKYADHYAVDFV